MSQLHTQNTVRFDPERQAYVIPSQPDLKFRRCSEFVESFFDHFDGPAIAAKLVATHPRYADRTAEELVAEWEAAADMGTKVHGQVQRYLQDGTSPEDLKAQHAVRWLESQYPSVEYARESEVVLCNGHLRIAGTADLLTQPKGVEVWDLVDWKTNKKIETKPFQNKQGVRGPARTWPDCNFFKYSLQLSLYRYLLEARGIKVAKQVIVHLTEDGVVPYPCEYLRSQVEAMIDHDISGPAMFAALDAL